MTFNNQTIIITNKNEIKVTELVKLNSFNEQEFNLTTSAGTILIIGNHLEMDNIDQNANELKIKGNIKKIVLDPSKEAEKKKKEKNFIKKIFK